MIPCSDRSSRPTEAPKAIGTYSQAVRVGDTVYVSGQIPLDPATGQLVSGDIEAEIRRVFDNLKAVAQAAGGSLDHVVKLSVFLTDLAHFAKVNEIMSTYFQRALSGARRDRRRGAAARRAGRDGVHTESRVSARPGAARARVAEHARAARHCGRATSALRPAGRSASSSRGDILFVLPLRYEDRTRVVPIGALQRGHARRGRGRGAAGRARVPPPPAAAGAPGRRHRLADAALLLFLQRTARGLARGTRLRCHGEVRRGPLGPGAGAPGVPAHRRPGRTAAADADADLSGHRRPDAGALARAGGSGAARTRRAAASPSCCREPARAAAAARRCAQALEFMHRPPVGTAARGADRGPPPGAAAAGVRGTAGASPVAAGTAPRARGASSAAAARRMRAGSRRGCSRRCRFT